MIIASLITSAIVLDGYEYQHQFHIHLVLVPSILILSALVGVSTEDRDCRQVARATTGVWHR